MFRAIGELFAAWLCLVGAIWVGSECMAAHGQVPVQLLLLEGSSSGPLQLDGSVHGNTAGATSLAVSLSTTFPNDIIIVAASMNGGPGVSVAGAGLNFSRRGQAGTTPSFIEEWYAVAKSPLSNATITVTQTSSAFMTVDAYGVSGGNTGSTFDGTPVTGNATPLSISTVNAKTFIIFASRNSQASAGAGSWGTGISSADFATAEYAIKTSTVSALSLDNGNAGVSNGCIADAIVAKR